MFVKSFLLGRAHFSHHQESLLPHRPSTKRLAQTTSSLLQTTSPINLASGRQVKKHTITRGIDKKDTLPFRVRQKKIRCPKARQKRIRWYVKKLKHWHVQRDSSGKRRDKRQQERALLHASSMARSAAIASCRLSSDWKTTTAFCRSSSALWRSIASCCSLSACSRSICWRS